MGGRVTSAADAARARGWRGGYFRAMRNEHYTEQISGRGTAAACDYLDGGAREWLPPAA